MASASKKVADVVAKIKAGKSTRFSEAEYRELIYALICDNEHTFEQFALKGGEITKDEKNLSKEARKFFSKMLKHAGLKSEEEIEAVLDTFEFSPKDLEWVSDIVDEAVRIYTDCGKSVSMMKKSIRSLSLKKVERSGKYAGQVTYQRKVRDLNKIKDKSKAKAAE